MSIEEITHDLSVSSAEFSKLNRRHWRKVPHRGEVSTIEYRALSPAVEKRIVDIAERIARLRRFEAFLRVKAKAL